jgi:hypothetical protein
MQTGERQRPAMPICHDVSMPFPAPTSQRPSLQLHRMPRLLWHPTFATTPCSLSSAKSTLHQTVLPASSSGRGPVFCHFPGVHRTPKAIDCSIDGYLAGTPTTSSFCLGTIGHSGRSWHTYGQWYHRYWACRALRINNIQRARCSAAGSTSNYCCLDERLRSPDAAGALRLSCRGWPPASRRRRPERHSWRGS